MDENIQKLVKFLDNSNLRVFAINEYDAGTNETALYYKAYISYDGAKKALRLDTGGTQFVSRNVMTHSLDNNRSKVREVTMEQYVSNLKMSKLADTRIVERIIIEAFDKGWGQNGK